jgi:hypothetical protein
MGYSFHTAWRGRGGVVVDGLSTGRWLHAPQPVAGPPDGSDAGAVIRWYRVHRDLPQQAAAALLNTTQSRLSKLETGSLTLGIDELRFIAAKLGHPTGTAGHPA